MDVQFVVAGLVGIIKRGKERMTSTSSTLKTSEADRAGWRGDKVTKKRVRFLDRSVAKELIQREKSSLEIKIQALRQKYNFSRDAENDSDDDNEKGVTNEWDFYSRGPILRDRPKSSPVSRTASEKGVAPVDVQLKTSRSASLSRLDELARPRGQKKPVTSLKKTTMIALSPDHLRLAIPQKSARTMNQLKDLPADELDYLMQPKSLKEFHALAEMATSSSRSGSRRSGTASPNRQAKRSDRSGKSTHGRPHTAGARTAKIAPSATEITSRSPTSTAKFKPSLKMAAAGVMSMNAPPSVKPDTKKESSAADAWTRALSVQSPHAVTGRYRLPGGRVLRLRPRRPAWVEHDETVNDADKNPKTNSKEVAKSKEDVGEKGTPRKDAERAGSNRFYRSNSRTLDISELTKDLAKCQYLRRRPESAEIDIADIFRR